MNSEECAHVNQCRDPREGRDRLVCADCGATIYDADTGEGMDDDGDRKQ